MTDLNFETAKQILNSPANYFGPTLDEFLEQNPKAQPWEVSDDKKLQMMKNQGKYNFFGPDEWDKFFHGIVDLSNIPLIPWSKDDLMNPVIKSPHFLFLGIDNMNYESTTIPLLLKLFQGPNHPKFYYSLAKSLNTEINKRKCETKWYLMHVDGYGKPGLSYEDLAFSLPIQYEPCHAIERVLGNILFYLLNDVYLDSTLTLVNDVLDPNSDMAFISSFRTDGLFIDSGRTGGFGGIAAARRVESEIAERQEQLRHINDSLTDMKNLWA